MLIPGNKNQCHHSFLSSASCCWSFRLLPTSHTTQKKEDEFSDVRGCGSRLEHSKLILYICELAFSLFSLSLSPLSIWYYIFFFFLFFYISSYAKRTNERTKKSTHDWEIYINPRLAARAISLATQLLEQKKKKGKKPLALFLFFFNIDIYIGERKKNLQVLYSSSELIVGTAVAAVQRHDSTFPNHFLKPPTTSNPTGIFSFFFFYFSIFLF